MFFAMTIKEIKLASLTVFTCLICALFAPAIQADELLLRDEFKPPFKRDWWWTVEPQDDNWTREATVPSSQDKLFFRFISGNERIKNLEIISLPSGNKVFVADQLKKSVMSPLLEAGEYKVVCTGVAGEEAVSLAVSTYRDGYLMPSWSTNNHTRTTHLPGGGLEIAPLADDIPASTGTRLFKFTPGRHYELNLLFSSDRVCELMLRTVQRKDGKRYHEVANLTCEAGENQNWTVNAVALSPSMDIALRSSSILRLQRLTVKEVPPPGRQKTVGDKVLNYEPRNPDPEPPNLDLQAPVVFQRPPRQIFEESVPQNFELVRELDIFRTPGEYAVWHFALHNPSENSRLEALTVTSLTSEEGNEITSDAISVSQVSFWDYPRGPYTYYNIPELIEPQQEGILEAGKNRIFWIQSRIPESTIPGVYRGTAQVKCGAVEIELPVRLRVLPFTLRTPTNMVWSVYARQHVRPQRGYPDELAVRYLRDMADYGVTALHRSLASEGDVRRFQNQRRLAGMNGPVIVYAIRAERVAMQRCGVEKDERWFENPLIRQAFVDHIKEFDSWFKKYGGEGYDEWLYMGEDEPHVNGMEVSYWQNKLAREAGIPTASCVYAPHYVNELSPWLNISCNSFISRSQKVYDELMQVAEGKPLQYWYLGGGCYSGQEGGLMPNRLDSGFMSFKLGVTGHLSYTYQAFIRKGKPDPYDNFSSGKSYGMTYPARNPTPEKVSVFSLEWEGIREGIVDYKYLYTLRELAAEARSKGHLQEAHEGELVIKTILERLPWRDSRNYIADGHTRTQDFNNDIADKMRAMAADAILNLMEVLP